MIDARVWLAWAMSGLVLASSTHNPLYALLLLLTVAVVAVRRVPSRTQQLLVLRFAALVVPLAALFNGLTAHLGDTVLLRLPERIPLLGGTVTAESLLFGATNGLLLAVIVGAFTVLNGAVQTHELVRLAPRAFHEAGVVLTIALTYLPQTGRTLRRIRQAQAVRGHRLRGLRDWLPIFVPLLVSGLERSMGLAEAMVARGYGAVASRAHPLRLRGMLALGLLSLLGGWLGWLFLPAWKWVALTTLLGGAALILAALWLAGRAAPRTTYRPRRITAASLLVLLGCAVALGAVLAPLPGSREALAYTPYPLLTLPPFQPLVGAGLLGMLVPALLRGVPEERE